jgi:hypothetical protein
MAVRFLSLLVVLVLAIGQMGGCEIRFNGLDDSTDSDSNQDSTGRGTTTEETIDISGLRLAVSSLTQGLCEEGETETESSQCLCEEGDDVIYGTVTNTSGVALAGIRVDVTLNLTNGGEETLKAPLFGQTVSRNDRTATTDKIVRDGLYATATGVFCILTGRSPDEIEPVDSGDFTVIFSDNDKTATAAGVSEPESRVIFPDVTQGSNPTEATNENTRIATGTVENDGDRTTFHTTVIYAFKASDGAILGIRKKMVSPTAGGTDGRLAAGETGRFEISVDTTGLGQLAATNLFLIQWVEEE